MKIFAGEQFRDIYGFAAAHNVTAIGGGDPNVGIAGWVMGGGHGPLTAKYGLGADQVIEMDVVTADGKLRTVNESNDVDLFWALRGVSCSALIPHRAFTDPSLGWSWDVRGAHIRHHEGLSHCISNLHYVRILDSS
jgi:FAD/FMN-containing dehydrogenase